MSGQTKSSASRTFLLAAALAASCSAGATDGTAGGAHEADSGSGGRGQGGTVGHGGAKGVSADAAADVGDARTADAATSDVAASGADTATTLDDAAMIIDSESDSPVLVDASALDAAALEPCPRPSVDRLEIWEAHGGSLKPAVGGNLLVKDGDRYYTKVDFLPGAEWHEIVVPLVNSLSKKVDLTSSKGFWLTYSATADLWVQLRPLSHAHGGEQYTAKLPSTAGALQETFISFAPANWGMLLGTPPFPFDQALRDANFFNFVGPPGTANSVIVKGLRIDGHVPPCS
jgi:hypothetical protein